MLITFFLMLLMAAVAEPLVLTLIGSKWLPSVIYLQLLCFSGMFYPLHALNLNILKVQGRSDLFLKLEVIKKLLAIPVIICGILFGIKILIVGMIVLSMIALFLNSHWSGKFINYLFKDQIKEILPSFILAAFIGAIVYMIGYVIDAANFWKLIMQFIGGIILYFLIAELTKMEDYLYIKSIVLEKLRKRN